MKEAKERRPSRGRWCRTLSAITIAKLMGCAPFTAKRYLYKTGIPPHEMTLEDLGTLIYDYRQKRELTLINRYLKKL